MLITDSFVYIHKPKTGGSFVTDALLELYNGRWNFFQHGLLSLRKYIKFQNDLGTIILTADKHGGCRNIPEKYRQLKIVTTIRNPFDYYVSQYEFGWWKRSEWLRHYRKLEGFSSYATDFPRLSFPQFMELMTMAFNPAPHQEFADPTALGRNTIEFIDYCFHEPKQVLSRLNEQYINSGDWKQDMYPVQFLFTHQLNRQLHQFLLQQGYPAHRIEFILNKNKVLPQGKGRSAEQKWERYYTPELKALVRKKDWLLFQLFPEFDSVENNKPSTRAVIMQ